MAPSRKANAATSAATFGCAWSLTTYRPRDDISNLSTDLPAMQHPRLAPVLHEFRYQKGLGATKFVEFGPVFYEIRSLDRNTGARRRCCIRALPRGRDQDRAGRRVELTGS